MSNPMQELVDYINTHTHRNDCQCQACSRKGKPVQPLEGSVVDMIVFQVAIEGAEADKLKELVAAAAKHGYHVDVNLFDTEEHSYLEVGAWLDSQELAFRLMAMGSHLGLWKLLSPKTMGMPKEVWQTLVGVGLVTIQHVPETVDKTQAAFSQN